MRLYTYTGPDEIHCWAPPQPTNSTRALGVVSSSLKKEFTESGLAISCELRLLNPCVCVLGNWKKKLVGRPKY